QVRIMGICILERPAAWAYRGPRHRPVARRSEHLAALEPHETSARSCQRLIPSHLEKRLAHKCGIPHGRLARLAVGFLVSDHQQVVDGLSGANEFRVVAWIT